MTEKQARTRGRRPAFSTEMILAEAIDILDESGENALTFRNLAARLSTGVGSIYHYVKNRDDLLDGATNQILDDILPQLKLSDEPFEAIRQVSYALYDVLQVHPWAGVYLMRDVSTQQNSMKILETIGQQFMRLGLKTNDCFIGAGTVLTYVVGSGADGSDAAHLPEEKLAEKKTQKEYLEEYAEQWKRTDPQEFPFLHAIADDFPNHDDREQFKEGLEFILDGVRVRNNL